MAEGRKTSLEKNCLRIMCVYGDIDIESLRWPGPAGLGIDLWVGCANARLPRHHEYDPMSDRRLIGRCGDLAQENTTTVIDEE